MLITKFNDRTIDNFINEFFGYQEKTINVSTNIKENNDCYELELILPGFKKDEIKLSVDNDLLIVNSQVEKTDVESYIKKDFIKTSFENKFILPKNVDKENIKAKMQDGILLITINKNAVDNLNKIIQID